jgi:Holliday junction resolvasome RuvABC endonuclease subunit
MKILGIDPGSKEIGFCIYEENKEIRSWEIKVKEKWFLDKTIYISSYVSELLKQNIDVVAIEKMFMMNKNSAPLISVQKIIVEEVEKNNIKVVEYAPLTWKKFMGNYKIEKKDSAEKIIDDFGMCGIADDTDSKIKYNLNAADATAIAICAAANNGSEEVEVSYDEYVSNL